MRLDTKRPTIIVTGPWNAAIFQQSWIARYLFQTPPGEQVRTANILVAAPVPKEIVYIDNVGLSVSNQRLEVFANTMTPVNSELAEQVLLRTLENLQHTPVGAMGVNFFLIQDDPDEDLLDMLQTEDRVNENYRILSQAFKSSIELEGCVLNVTRSPSAGEVTFNFNFHYENLRSLDMQEVIVGSIERNKNQALDFMRTIYNLEGVDIESHNLDALQELEAKNG